MFDNESDLRAMENNLLCHFSYLARKTEGMEVIDNPHYPPPFKHSIAAMEGSNKPLPQG